MPQWNRDRVADIASGADERAIAVCSVSTTALLAEFDHHVVQVGGREAVLISYHLRNPENPDDGAPYVQVSFAHPGGHPTAPANVQALVDTLTFTPWDGYRPRAL